MDSVIYQDKAIEIMTEEHKVFIKVVEKSYPVQAFNDVVQKLPRVKVTEFTALKQAFLDATGRPVKIGEEKPLIDVTISSDQLVAYAIIHMTQTEFKDADKRTLLEGILRLSDRQGVIYGQDLNQVVERLQPEEPFIIAQGEASVPGEDAVVTMYPIQAHHPELSQDGSVNHYELNLIEKVKENDWLGERLEPTEGTSGMTVKGDVIPPTPGLQMPLQYDPSTVRVALDPDGSKTVLYARRSGAVIYGKHGIGVSNYLNVDGNVSFYTGNIDFEGFVDVVGTIEDNFSVVADHDIQILGDMGVGGVELIESRHGNIYIRGGIAGKHKAVIRCNGDLYTKFAADCTIECSGVVNIGFYALNCHIKAKEVILEAQNSQIIGGVTQAIARVRVNELGSRAGIKTQIIVTGFAREHVQKDYELLDAAIEDARRKMDRVKKELNQLGIPTSEKTRVEKQSKEDEFEKYKIQLEQLSKRRSSYISFLRAKGSGEVAVGKCMHPNVAIHIQDQHLVSESEVRLPQIFYLKDGMIQKD